MGNLCFYMSPFPGVKSYYDMIDAAVEHKLNAVEGFCMYEFATPDIKAAEKIRAYADSKGVSFPCFSVFVEFASDAETTQKLKGYADVAKILGSPYLHHTIVGEFENCEKILPYKEEYYQKGVAAVREVYDYAESIGIKTIFEEQGYVFNGISGFGRFLNDVNREVCVVADFGNIYESNDDLLAFIDAFGDRVVHAHIKDVILKDENSDGKGFSTLSGKFMYAAEVGKGIVKIKEAVDALKKAGYDGYYGLEFGIDSDDSACMDDIITMLKAWI